MGPYDFNIQFFNYLFSILAAVFEFIALWIVLSNEAKRDEEMKDLRERINTLIRINDNKKK